MNKPTPSIIGRIFDVSIEELTSGSKVQKIKVVDKIVNNGNSKYMVEVLHGDLKSKTFTVEPDDFISIYNED